MSSQNVQNLLMQMSKQLKTQQDDLQNANIVYSDLKSRNRMIDLSIGEIDASKKEHVWESCGKAFIKVDSKEYGTKLKHEKDSNVELMNDLNKKRHYLETSIGTTVDNMNKILDKVGAAH
ncbi:DEKNAAC102777 [Brettanomyces naardenensis]|uniref:DEKNAAC102778 n=1 Tax=Brettanomyces naardenensis TaxID=13370 RepID=A0A448YKD4_BRENA|nr:DEKNAAC102777 [Brettanomyces naardenensis]